MKLTETDIDQLTSGMFIFIHATERIVRELVNHYEAIDKDSKEYKLMVKHYGKVRAQQWLHDTERKIMLQAKGQMLHQWLDAAKQLIAATDKATDVGMMSGKDGVEYSDLADGLMNDTNYMCRMYFLNGNVNPDDYVKVESTIKLLWDKEHRPVKSELIDLFRMN